MRFTALKVGAVVLGTVGFYTMLANSIPQVESEVPSELAFTGTVTPDQLVAAGNELYQGAGGCVTCHGLGTRAPNLLTDEAGTGLIGARCSDRVAGQDCKAYLHESLVNPGAFVVPGYDPIMPDMSRTLSPTQIWALVAYLESLGGTVTVSAEDLPAEGATESGSVTGGSVADPGAAAGPLATTSLEPREILAANQCMLCHKLGDEGGAIGPPFDGMAALDAERIRRGILLPNADTADGYAALAGTMPQTFGAQLTAAQLEALVVFLGGGQ
jgi:mono/diheme cytochrome c family protein